MLYLEVAPVDSRHCHKYKWRDNLAALVQKKTSKSQNTDAAITQCWSHLKPACVLAPNQPCSYQVIYSHLIYIATATNVAHSDKETKKEAKNNWDFFFFFFLRETRLHFLWGCTWSCVWVWWERNMITCYSTLTAARTFDVAQILTGTITAITAPVISLPSCSNFQLSSKNVSVRMLFK